MLIPLFPGVKVGTFTRVIVTFTQFSAVKVAHKNRVRISHRELASLQPVVRRKRADWAHDFRVAGLTGSTASPFGRA